MKDENRKKVKSNSSSSKSKSKKKPNEIKNVSKKIDNSKKNKVSVAGNSKVRDEKKVSKKNVIEKDNKINNDGNLKKKKFLSGLFKKKNTNKKESESVKKYKENKAKRDKARNKFSGKFNLDILDLLILVVATAIISCVLTGLILNYQFKKNTNFVDSGITSDKNVQEFLNTYSEIIQNYYEEIDSEAMMKAAMEGMLNFLEDTYSIYMDKDESNDLSEMLDGSYEGIGIVVRGNIIEDIYKKSPAEKAGLAVGDEIISINDSDISMENYQDIGGLIKPDKENVIVVMRKSKEMSFKVKAGIVNIPATTSDVIKSSDKKKNIGYISLNAFSTLAFEDFKDSLYELENKENISSLIIDLRSNSGGYLNVATNISNLFLEKGEIIYSLENKNKITTYKDESNEKRDYKIVVLVNANTASAAEILTSALHDSYGAVVVGTTTYGKGKVQTMKYYDDSIVKYTSAKWLRPNGECIDEKGIIPDYKVNIKIEGTTIYDLQLDKAIEILSK